jgi:hypothetical protein
LITGLLVWRLLAAWLVKQPRSRAWRHSSSAHLACSSAACRSSSTWRRPARSPSSCVGFAGM